MKAPMNSKCDPVVMVDIDELTVVDQPMPEIQATARDMLRKSIQTFGIKVPIRVSEDFEIIDGRTRFEIAKELGINKIPCMISDTLANPTENVLKYDIELGKRSISSKERSSLEMERENYLSQIRDESFKKVLKKISPKLRDIAKSLFKKTGDVSFIAHIAEKPEEVQEEYINEFQVISSKEIKGDVADELNRLTRAESDLKRELKSIKRNHDELQKKYNETYEMYVFAKNEAQDKLQKMKVGIEEELREKYRAESPDKVKKLIEEETKRVEQVMKDEMLSLQKDLRNYSQALAEEKEKINEMKEQLSLAQNEKDDLTLAKEELEKKLNETKTLIEGLVRPSKFINRMEATFNDLNNTYWGIIEAGGERNFEDGHKKLMRINIEKIDNVLMDLMELFGVERRQNGTASDGKKGGSEREKGTKAKNKSGKQ
jgi:ParB-like chromosome segregation protein Spo0J